MLIIADTSPLNYLAMIGAAEVLAPLFGRIVIPPQVYHELRDASTPESVRLWSDALPAWIVIQKPGAADDRLSLGAGEAAAISLAQELHADWLLIDDRDGRALATQLGIRVAGTLAVLRDAALSGHLELRPALDRLNKTNFRASPRLFEQVLREFETARKT